jgi:hypothetical protein
MSVKGAAAVAVAVIGLIGSPPVRADEPAAPRLWEGTIVGVDGRPASAEVVAFARPSGLGLDEGTAPLAEIARIRTDDSGHYALRSLHTEALRRAEDHDGWTNVMVAAFGDGGSFTLAFDSLAWVPAGGFRAAAADGPGASARGRWVTTPAARLAAEQGEISALSADAAEDPAEVAQERPPVMVLSGRGEPAFSAQGSAPKPNRPADPNCMALLRSEDLGEIKTKVGEVHLDRDWNGFFSYTTSRHSSFQVGVRPAGQGWSVGGSTSSLQNTQATSESSRHLPPERLHNFAADLRYGRYFWRCYGRGDRWYDAESIQPYTWKGGLWPSAGGPEPGCKPDHTSPVTEDGVFKRAQKQSTTYEGAISVAGFAGSVTTTIAQGVETHWNNKTNRVRFLCGDRYDIASTKPNRIRSLP